MKILSVFSLLVATNADFKASPVCIAGTTCVGFGVTFTGWLAAQEAFHSNHEVPKSASDSKGGPELGSFFDDDLQVGESCGLRRLDSDGVHRRLDCAKGLSCISRAICAEDVGEGGACGDSAGGVDCKSDLWCSESEIYAEQAQIDAGDTKKLHRCQDSFWKSGTLVDIGEGAAIAGVVIATGGVAAAGIGSSAAAAGAAEGVALTQVPTLTAAAISANLAATAAAASAVTAGTAAVTAGTAAGIAGVTTAVVGGGVAGGAAIADNN